MASSTTTAVSWLGVMVKRLQTVVKERNIWKLNDIHFFYFFFACHPGPNTNLICPRNMKLNWNGLTTVYVLQKRKPWEDTEISF